MVGSHPPVLGDAIECDRFPVGLAHSLSVMSDPRGYVGAGGFPAFH